MRYSRHILFLITIAFCFSCKKSKLTPTDVQVAPIAPITDSASFSINGKVYTVISNVSEEWGSGNQEANLKFDSIGRTNNVYYYSGAKDSVLFNHDITLLNHAKTTGDDISLITFSVIKKYGKNQLVPSGGIVQPKTMLDLYEAGNYNYAFDYKRENSQNGIAIGLTHLFGGGGVILKSYSGLMLRYPTTVTKATQAGADFQIISITKSEAGQYYIIAKFNATLFDSNENQVKLSNGYLRLVLQ